MTDLEIMQRAKLYMDKLARGIDPVTDREIPEDGVLGQVIANGGVVGQKVKPLTLSIMH